ncbi:hypothetical protein J437_LFUL005187 [Ladona fulva]|uniref:Uncharacterized protein n=1 Tax=Ladona fulva TaxID=123851 RepID=A0A8K0P5V8_LADFU|nr:hypothetical protein J437_LFUL005187 [Ladona fulva]
MPVPRVLPTDCSSPNGSEDSHYYITPNKNDVSFSLKLSETSIEGADYTNIEVPQSKTPRSKEKCELSLSFSSAITCSEGERYLNLVVEREFNGTHEKSLSCSEDCNSPKTPSSPVYPNSRNEVEFPNYANVTSAAIPILQNAGQAFSTSVPPPVPPRLE